jgi:hypothetical protein
MPDPYRKPIALPASLRRSWAHRPDTRLGWGRCNLGGVLEPAHQAPVRVNDARVDASSMKRRSGA